MQTPPPDALISAYLDGALDAQQAEALSAWLSASPDHARYVASLVIIERGLVQQCKKESAGNLLAELAEMEANAEIDGLVDLTEELKNRKRDKARAQAERRMRIARTGSAGEATRSVIVVPTIAAVGAIAAGLLIVALIFLRTAPQQPGDGQTVQTPPHADPLPGSSTDGPVVLARVVDQVGSRWAGRQGGAQIGASIYDESLTLARGTVELELDGGGTLIVEGPARLTLRDEGRIELAYGRVVSLVPTAASGMTIVMSGVTLENNGAEFGCVATEEGSHRVDVFAGSVKALSMTEGVMRLDTGEALLADRGTLAATPTQRSGYVRDLARLHYRDAVLADAPISYWPLQDDPSTASVEDAVRGGMRLFPRFAPLVQVVGPLGGDAFMFDGEGILDLAADGLRTTDRYSQPEAFTFEAWVRPSDTHEAGYLIITNTSDLERSGWGFGVKPTRAGVVPFLAVGMQSWDFPDAEFALDHWTHLAVTVSPDATARVYVDGREADTQIGVTGPPHIPQYVHLVGRSAGERWRGALAHAAYYDRALTHDEIHQHADYAAQRRAPDRN